MYLVVYSFMYLVVYLVVDSLVNLVVYYSVYLVVYLVYLVVHSSKQLSPLIKACNPISPVLLLSSRCFDFKALWIFPHHCPWSPYLFHNNCAGELYLWLCPTDPTVSQGGRGHTHITHQPNRDVGESEPDCQHCNKHQLTALRQILCVLHLQRW